MLSPVSVLLSLLAVPVAPAAPVLAERVPLPPMALRLPALAPHPASAHQLTVKFGDAHRARLRDGALVFEGPGCPAAQALVDGAGSSLRPLIGLPVQRLAALEARAAARSGTAAADLAGIMVVDDAPDGPALLALARSLQALSCVEYAHIAATHPPPPGDISPTTPDYTGEQGYLGPDPGIDALGAHALGTTGAHVRLADCEYGWEVAHEDLVDIPVQLEPDHSIHPTAVSYGWDDHGTAVLGETSAPHNGYGVSGAAPDAAVAGYTEWSTEGGYRRAEAIAAAVSDAAAGDVVLLEMQAGGCDGAYVPAETDPSVFTITETAVAAGVVVVAAAGNGGADLDAGCYASGYSSWGDSGAILVGAGSASTAHNALSFSTFGANVDLQGWGTSVFTTGYGNILGLRDPTGQTYTDSFGGTSSASPIVAATAVLVQDHVQALGHAPLSPALLRDLLVATGRPQGSGGHIGPLPDVVAAIEGLDGDGDGHIAEDWGGDDCDDAAAQAHPGAEEVWYDGVDGDCLGGDDFDADGDGVPAMGADAVDCNDADPAVGPHVDEVPDNGVDDDCDGVVDDGEPGPGDSGLPGDDGADPDGGRDSGLAGSGGGGGKDGCSAAPGLPSWLGLGGLLLIATRRRRRTG